MKKLELKNLKIKVLSPDEQTSINGGKLDSCTDPCTTNTDHCDAHYTYNGIPDAPGGHCPKEDAIK